MRITQSGMHIIYHCYGSAHSSIIAAAIHLGRLPSDRVPDKEEILALPDFDTTRDDSLGHIFFKGRDEKGHAIYTAGMGRHHQTVKRLLLEMIRLNNGPESSFKFVEALPSINKLAKLGGALSRRYGLVMIGRPLAAIGIMQSYQHLVELVHKTKEEVKNQEKGSESTERKRS
ncbi:DUF3189 family protein [Caldalkalibacillus thermarum TA2.A1]|uniref:DUF3189 family protein n=1 Tax=Caldalkalibacillus thermarum (strain TA2.A1) TaxID=986075 RepID=A0A8X8I8D0_CALTT|nr:DUF3189 family protein [Caldalkalibacillus thermarum]QZT32630.1 DUF3189 family protein [Caldalkalibacillus thermarum TA2.A1]GGK18906.1 hypothetical protein GCM10010965_09880 [Caldalkalibacillus thermarum]